MIMMLLVRLLIVVEVVGCFVFVVGLWCFLFILVCYYFISSSMVCCDGV